MRQSCLQYAQPAAHTHFGQVGRWRRLKCGEYVRIHSASKVTSCRRCRQHQSESNESSLFAPGQRTNGKRGFWQQARAANFAAGMLTFLLFATPLCSCSQPFL